MYIQNEHFSCESISPLLINIHWLPIRQRILYKLLLVYCLIYRLVYCLVSRSKFLTIAMIDAANKAIGKVKCSVNGKEWMSRDIREVVKRQNTLRRDITNKRAEWIEACMTVRDMIRESKQNKCKECLEDSGIRHWSTRRGNM